MRFRTVTGLAVSVVIAISAGIYLSRQEAVNAVAVRGTHLPAQADKIAPAGIFASDGASKVTTPWVQPQVSADPLAGFDDWSRQYLSLSPEQRQSMIDEGVRLAKSRRPVFKELIKGNPRQALERAVPMVVRQKLPLEILNELEKRVNKRAAVTVYQGVPAEGQPMPALGETLTHRIAELAGEGAYNLHVYGRRAESVLNVPNAALNGVIVDREFAASESPLRTLEVGEIPDASKQAVTICPVSGKDTLSDERVGQAITTEQQDSVIQTPEENIYLCGPYHATYVQEQLIYGEGTTGGPVVLTGSLPAPPTPAIGQLKILYIPMTFQDQNANLPTESKSYEIMRNVADYYSKSSFGKLTTLTTVTPHIKLPKNEAWYVQRDTSNGGDVDGLGLEMAHAREEARKIGFDWQDYDCTVLRLIGGARSTGGWGGGGNVWVYGDQVGVTAHEIGHSFGLSHANFWDTSGTSSIGPGANEEYGDSYDVMGGGSVPIDHYNAAAKVQVKWLPQNYVQNITSSGLYRLHAFDQQVLDPRNRYALTITKDSQRTYWGELRQLYTGSAGRPWADKGMILGWKYPNGSGSNIQLIDTTAGSPYGRDDAAIALGQTFSDTESGIHITTVDVSTTTPKYVDVLVNIGDYPANHAPTLTIASSATVVPTGATVTFTATAADTDGDTLAYQWQHWGDTNLKLVSPNSPVITRTFSTTGSYVVSCTVSDMKGGKTTRTLLITVGDGGSKYTISGRVTAGGVGVPEVLLTANGLNSTTTDSDGYYIIANLTANTYSVTPALYGYAFSELFNNSISVGPNYAGGHFEAESLPAVSLMATDASATENGAGATGTFRLSRTGDTAVPLTVNVNPAIGTSSTGDYALNPALTGGSGGFSTFTIPVGASDLDIVLTTVNDAAAEGPETVKFALAAGSGYLVTPNAGTATIVIEDDDTTLPKVGVSATTDTVDEGTVTPGVFTFTRTGPTTAALTVNYTTGGTAAAGSDYTALSGTVSIPIGSANATVNLLPLNDSSVESLENAVVTVSSNLGYVIDPTLNTATVNLLDDDTNVVNVTATDAIAQEVDLTVPGSAANTGTFLVTRTGDTTSPLTVYYSLAGSPSTGVPALHGVDFEALPGVLLIPAGAASASITIVPRWDGFGETPEQVLLQLGAGPTDYKLGASTAATVTLNDSDASNAPYVEIASATAAVEGGSSGVFTFSLKGSIAGSVSVPFSLSGTAILNTDYTVTLPVTTPISTFDSGTGTGVIVMSGSASSANTLTLTLVPVNDSDLEDIESIVCTLTPSAAVSTYAPSSSASIWLRDNDQPTVWADSQVGISSDTINRITEGAGSSPFKFYVSRTGSTASALTVNFSLNGTATPGVDYTVTTGATLTFDNGTRLGTLTIPAGSSGANLTLSTTGTDDSTVEGMETIIFHAEPGSYSKTVDATIFMDDNDTGSQTVAFTSTGGSGLESVTSVNVPVTLAAPSSGTTTVGYTVEGGLRTSTSSSNVTAALPFWTRVVRAGTSLTSYVSADGVDWRQVGATTTISMSSASYTAGLIAMSSTAAVTATFTMDNFSITGLDSGSPGSAVFGSVGTTSPASTSSVSSGTYTLNAGGAGLSINSTSDTSCYVSHAITNSANCVVTARVVSMSGGNGTSRAGVTIRETTATSSRHMTSLTDRGVPARLITRTIASGNATTATGILRPYWVRLRRVGDAFSAFSSVNGTSWVQTSTTRTIPMGLDVQAGLAVSARSDGALATAVFDNVTIDGVAATGLTGRTIGYVNAQGGDALVSGTYTVTGSGAQIGSTEDECHFVAKTLTGDFDLVARVTSQTGGGASSQAGVMARELHNYRSLSAYSGMVANSHHEYVSRSTSVSNAYGSGVDFSLVNGTLTFNNGEQTKNIVIAVNNDSIAEPNESITLRLLNPTASVLGTNTVFTYVIDDDDTAPVLPYVGFALASSSAPEATAGLQLLDVSLSAPASAPVSVAYTLTGGTATGGGVDFDLVNGTLVFAPGETVKSVPLVIMNDSAFDAAETVIVSLSTPVGAVLGTLSAHTFTIQDDDLPVVSIVATDASAAEAGLDPGSFTISRTGSTAGSLDVTLARSGTATTGSDYAAIGGGSTPFVLTLPPGAVSATITVTPVNDSSNEGSETLILAINANASLYTLGTPSSATVTIADDDRSTVTITATDGTASETPGNTGTFTVTRTVPTTALLAVSIAVSGTATNGTDYSTITTTVNIPANQASATITVTPVNDLVSEGDETVLVTLASGSYTIGSANFDEVVIQDNDYAPVITIESPDANGALVASGQGIIVSGTASDDGSPAPVTTAWSLVSGPGTATIATPSALSSAVTFSTDGVYVLRFSATDTQFTVSDQVVVVVGSAIAASDWIAQDMGPTTQQRGQSARSGSSRVLTGMGGGYAAVTQDTAHTMTRQVTGDGTIVARLTALTGPASTPLAGVTIRDSLNRSANRAVLGYSGGALQFRTRTTVTTTDSVVMQSSITLPVWVRLQRVSSTGAITASYAPDAGGAPGTWNTIGTSTVITMLNDTTQMGLTATGNSSTPANLCTATFDNVALTPVPAGAALVSENYGTAPSTQATFAFDGTTYTVAAADSFDGNGAFYGWQYSGDLMVTAKHVDATSGALNAKSGIMMRESMDGTAGYAHVGRIPTSSFDGYVWRSVASGGGGGVPSFTAKIRWMRLIREGNRITAFHAPDSGGSPGTWIQLGSPRTVIMSPNVLIGFTVDNAGGTAGVLNTAQFSNLSIVPLNKAPNISVASTGDLSPISLDGTVTDDSFPLPVSLTTQWSLVSGPGAVTFGNASAIDTTASLSANGLHTVRLRADDSSILSFRDYAFTAYTGPFAKWLETTSTGDGDQALAEENADIDGDGLVNLYEYAVGTNGTIATNNPQVVTLAPVSSSQYLRISIPKNPAATDVTFTVQATSDLMNPASWSSAGLVIETNTSTQLVVRDNVAAGPDVRRFMRVRLTRP
ncbi:MAG: Calx-beta domain-containing protein [Verrucomicrobiota bacterium]